MTDEDIRQMVRDFKSFVSIEMESIHQRVDGMEAAITNELRTLARRVARLEDRVARLEEAT